MMDSHIVFKLKTKNKNEISLRSISKMKLFSSRRQNTRLEKEN